MHQGTNPHREAAWTHAILFIVAGILVGEVIGATIAANAIETNCSETDAKDFSGSSVAQDISDDDDLVYQNNYWQFGGGRDVGWSQACADTSLFGGGENDDLHLGNGNDIGFGGNNNDDIWGGASAIGDQLSGSAGADELSDAEGSDADELWGDAGPDILDALDGDGADSLTGGTESDTCIADDHDYLDSC